MKQYIIKQGDTLSKIALAFHLSLEKLEAANPQIKNPNSIYSGAVIYIPEGGGDPNHSAPHPQPKPAPPQNDIQKGYYFFTWSSHHHPMSTDIDFGVAFSGHAKVNLALQEAERVRHQLQGDKYICIGGGTRSTGYFTHEKIQNLNNAINAGELSDFQGLVYDVEVGDAGLETIFQASFAAAKTKGLKVIVTVSHSEPYAVGDSQTLMRSFLADEHIDVLSPQLYDSGKEDYNKFDNIGVHWSAYANTNAAILPSIVRPNLYENAKEYFEEKGISLGGYIRWR